MAQQLTLKTRDGVLSTIEALRDGSSDAALITEIQSTADLVALQQIAVKRRLAIHHKGNGQMDAEGGVAAWSRCRSVAERQALMVQWVKNSRESSLFCADQLEKALPTMKFDA